MATFRTDKGRPDIAFSGQYPIRPWTIANIGRLNNGSNVTPVFNYTYTIVQIMNTFEFTVYGVRYSVNDDNTTVTVAGYPSDSKPTGNLTIPKSVTYGGISYPVTSIGNEAFDGCSGLTSVTIPNSVTSIGEGAFCDCSGLTSVTIPNSVTYIGVGAFDETAWYNNQPDGLVYAGLVAYKYKGTMPNGTSIVLKEGTKGIVGYAFDGCSGLTSVTIPNSVTYIGLNAFDSCIGLTSVTIPNSVTYIDLNAFSGCSGLTSIKVESGNSVYDSRENCNAIIETATNTLISGCKNTIIPNSVTSIGDWAFFRCRGLTSVTIPNSVTSIGDEAFWGCIGLTRIDAYPNPEKVSTGVYAFNRVPKNGTLHVLPKYLSAYQTASEWEDFINIKGDLTEIGASTSMER